MQLGDRGGDEGGVEPDEGCGAHLLAQVAVGVLIGARPAPVAVVGGEEGVHLDGVHPHEQLRVLGRICLAGDRVGAVDVLVDGLHDAAGGLRLLHRAVGRRHDVLDGALQPAPRVGAVVAVLLDAGHGQRVQSLDQQGAHAADEHGGVGMDTPGHAVGIEHPLTHAFSVTTAGDPKRGHRSGRYRGLSTQNSLPSGSASTT